MKHVTDNTNILRKRMLKAIREEETSIKARTEL